MYSPFDEQILLGAEATVSLDLDGIEPDAQDWSIGREDALDTAEREAWSRHDARAAGLATASLDDDGFSGNALTDAVRRVMHTSWD